jgi:hypothetical protein
MELSEKRYANADATLRYRLSACQQLARPENRIKKKKLRRAIKIASLMVSVQGFEIVVCGIESMHLSVQLLYHSAVLLLNAAPRSDQFV